MISTSNPAHRSGPDSQASLSGQVSPSGPASSARRVSPSGPARPAGPVSSADGDLRVKVLVSEPVNEAIPVDDPIAVLSARIASIGPDIPGADRAGRETTSRRGTAAGGSRRSRRSSIGQSGAEPGAGPPGDPEVVAKQICLRLLTIAPRPRAGLAQTLARRGIPVEVADQVLDRLTQVGLIDDAAYAAAFVRTKQRDRALGRAALRTELRRRGVDEEPAGRALAQVDPEMEWARAEALVAKRVDAAMVAGGVAARRRLLGLLARRGYPADLAIGVVEGALSAYPAD